MRSSLIEPRSAPNNNIYYAQPSSNFRLPPSPSPMPVAQQQRRFPLVPSEGWLPLLLLSIAVYSVVYSVTAAIIIDHSNILWLTTALGLLCGLAISKSRYFQQGMLHVGACILGYWLALFATSLFAYHVSVLEVLANLRAVISSGFSLAGAQNSEMIFLFYLAFLCFFLGYFGSWLTYRAHLPWLVALVYVSIMLVNLNYVANRDLSFLVVILVGSLILLIARVQLAGQLARWKSEGLYTDQTWLRHLTFRFLRIAALFVLLILPLSWFLPTGNQPPAGTTFWNNLDNAWANISHGNLSALTNPNSLFGPYDPPANFFSDQLAITGSVNLPHGPVLSYIANSTTQGQYLEGFTFNTFDGHTWTLQTSSTGQSYSANTPIPQDSSTASYTPLTTMVTILQPPEGTRNYIFAPADPGSFTVPTTVFTDAAGSFISVWTQNSPLRQNERYQVLSEVPNASPSDLATTPFPDADPDAWQSDLNYNALRQYYMQKPADLSPEVLETARIWTKGASNVYTAVLDLQEHLSNPNDFTYSVTNPPVPSNIDAVTWLLHTHKGYCTYYATAMAIMARLLDIPARVVSGFSQGTYNPQQKAWIVNGNDAHSWVQIYFPDAGWVNFDPTPGFSTIGARNPVASPTPGATTPAPSNSPTATPRKPVGTQPTHAAGQTGGTPSLFSGGSSSVQNLFLAFSLVILLCSFMVLAVAIARYRVSRSSRSRITTIYARLCKLAGLVGSPHAAWQTPYEYTFALSQRFPQASATLRRLADLFVRERWAAPHQAPGAREEQELVRLWPRLRNTILRSFVSSKH
ncbi:MAG TPA: transglutaminase domain-containing protein [Ktedonobacteraceae bacterium]|nr:transglutaminase domain-containing protein [Ktedonobacteraceae bacterium]